MSNTTLLFILVALVLVSGFFLTSSWGKYLAYRRKKKKMKDPVSH